MSRPTTSHTPVIVTGAAGGIGAAVARTATHRWPRRPLVLTDRDGPGLEAIVAALGADAPPLRVHPCDLTDSAAVAEVFTATRQEFGPPGAVAHCAGTLRPATLVETDDALLEHHLAVNTRAVLHVLRSVAGHLADNGAVVVVSSNAARVPRTSMAAYAASKAAASALTRCAGLELAARGIRCNVVEPGATRTAMQQDLWPDPETATRAAAEGDPTTFRIGTPLGRMAEAEDVAEAICFLLSDQARHITLQQLFVDGGASL